MGQTFTQVMASRVLDAWLASEAEAGSFKAGILKGNTTGWQDQDLQDARRSLPNVSDLSADEPTHWDQYHRPDLQNVTAVREDDDDRIEIHADDPFWVFTDSDDEMADAVFVFVDIEGNDEQSIVVGVFELDHLADGLRKPDGGVWRAVLHADGLGIVKTNSAA